MPRTVHDRGEGAALGPPSFITRASRQPLDHAVLGSPSAPSLPGRSGPPSWTLATQSPRRCLGRSEAAGEENPHTGQESTKPGAVPTDFDRRATLSGLRRLWRRRHGRNDVEARLLYEVPRGVSTPTWVNRTHARAAIAAMASGLPAEAAFDVELLTSEVVSNAVKHAKLSPSDEIIVRFVMDGYVRVEVMDPGHSTPNQRGRIWRGGIRTQVAGDCRSSTLTRRLGGSNQGGGKKVWFEVGPR